MNASSTHITPDTLLKYALAGLSFLIITIVASLLFASAPKAQAQSCTTTSLGSLSASALADQAQQGGDSSETDTDTLTVDVSNYVGSNESADSISIPAQTDADVSAGCSATGCGATGKIVVDSSDNIVSTLDGPGYDSNSGTVNIQVSDADTVEIKAYANASVGQDVGPEADANADTTGMEITVCDDGGGGEPVAVDDGTIDQQACTGFQTQTIDVVDNDYHTDGQTVYLRSVENTTSNGGTATIDTQTEISYTPSQLGTDTFDYTITDGNSQYDSATVTLDVNGDGCGSVTITAEDQSGNPADLGQLGFEIQGYNYSGSGSSYTLSNINLSDTPIDVRTGSGFISDPDYEVEFFDKQTQGDDGEEGNPTRSQLAI